MVFKSVSQANLCWAKYNQAIKRGDIPSWDCYKWEKETKGKKLPFKISPKTSPKKKSIRTSPKKSVRTTSPKVYREAYYRKPYTRKDPDSKKSINVKGSRVSAKLCPKGQILREGFTYVRKSSGKIVKVSPRCIKDTGRKGKYKGTKLDLPKISLSDFGYKMANSERDRRKSLREAVKAYGYDTVRDKILKLSILFANKPQSSIVNDDLVYVRRMRK